MGLPCAAACFVKCVFSAVSKAPFVALNSRWSLSLVVIESSAQGDGIVINSGVKILESRLDMTKRARKTLNYEN